MWPKRLKGIELEAKSEVKNKRGNKQETDSREESKTEEMRKKTAKGRPGK